MILESRFYYLCVLCNVIINKLWWKISGTEKPPKFCGWNDESGEDLFCCEKMTNEENAPQEAQYG